MNGLELSRQYFEAAGDPVFYERFQDVIPYLAFGLCGGGSECFGFDDAVSRDHDFEPGFCVFLPDEKLVDRRTEFLLERAYSSLPKEFAGFTRQRLSPVGGNRHGVIRTADFIRSKTGTQDGILTVGQWLTLPEQYLAEVTNGAVYRDDYGEFTEIRRRLAYLPEDIRLKKLAGHLLLSAQAGQYNFLRSISHSEPGAAQLAVFEFAKHYAACVFLLNRRYMPFYKWQFRAMRHLPLLGDTEEDLYLLLTTDNSPSMSTAKADMIENLCTSLISALQDSCLTDAICGDLEKHAYSVNDRIADASLRNADILAGV